MISAECGALPGGKVGGMGDVLAAMPPALAALGQTVHVLLPSYGVYQDQADVACEVAVDFAGSSQRLTLHRLQPLQPGVQHWVLHHPAFGSPPGQIYHHDGDGAPFATDANLYALFSLGAAHCLQADAWGPLDVLHLHDWHGAGVLLFRETFNVPRVVFTIHNLALQGQRPLHGHPSSLSAWYPDLICPADAIDAHYTDCYNPMRLGIRSADRVHAVSPTYAREIQQPNGRFIRGGEGLEADLAEAADADRLVGILNGYDPEPAPAVHVGLITALEHTLRGWIAEEGAVASAHYLALRNLERLRGRKKGITALTSITRVTPQKLALMQEPIDAPGTSALDALLAGLRSGECYVLLGTGDADLERFLTEVSARHDNFVFLNGYSETVAQRLYAEGALFLMPSVFEPCGISQMMAMAHGQPCVVHGVGGLADTVRDAVDGFVFTASDAAQAAHNMLDTVQRALTMRRKDAAGWQVIVEAARNKRFPWRDAAKRYLSELYER